MQYDLLLAMASGADIPDELANANDIREQIAGIFYLIASIISAITFIMWFRRAYYNLHQKVGTLSLSEGWAAGSWFIPIVCLYRPYQIMKELYIETKELLKRNGFAESVNYTTSYLGWWWGLWIASGIIGNFILRFSLRSAETIDDYIELTIAQMVISVLGIPLALITIKIIKDYSGAEPLLHEIKENLSNRNTETRPESNNP